MQSYHWAHLTFVRRYRVPIIEIGSGGTPYVADTHGPWHMELECECGHMFSMPESAFPGRRKLKSCGRPECPHTKPDKLSRAPRERGVALSVYLSLDIAQRLKDESDRQRISFSKLVESIAREYFLRQLVGE
jgi:hypothetical protein